MDYDFTVNERLSVVTQHVGCERQPVLVIDDFLRDPESMVRYAVHEARFQPSPIAYPGIIAPAPNAYVEGLVAALVPMIAATFGVKGETAYLSDCNLSIATFPAEQLHFGQRLPHVDTFEPGMIAILHYLCAGTHGGTGMYRHRTTGYESLTQEQNEHMKSLIAQDIARNPVPAQYPNVNSPLFEQTAAFQVRFNRLIAYRSRILHSMIVDANTKLDPDPRRGRLTANTFLQFELA
jgi:Family of unknown function (DUF6445)